MPSTVLLPTPSQCLSVTPRSTATHPAVTRDGTQVLPRFVLCSKRRHVDTANAMKVHLRENALHGARTRVSCSVPAPNHYTIGKLRLTVKKHVIGR